MVEIDVALLDAIVISAISNSTLELGILLRQKLQKTIDIPINVVNDYIENNYINIIEILPPVPSATNELKSCKH